MANLFHTIPGLNYTVTDMDTARLKEELNTALSRYCGPMICMVGDNRSLPVFYESLHLCFYQLAIEFFSKMSICRRRTQCTVTSEKRDVRRIKRRSQEARRESERDGDTQKKSFETGRRKQTPRTYHD